MQRLNAAAQINSVVFSERHTKAQAGSVGHQGVVARLTIQRLGSTGIDVNGAGHAVGREIRIRGTDHELSAGLAGVDFQTQVITRAHEIFLPYTRHDGKLITTGETRAKLQIASWLFSHCQSQVDLVWRIRHFLSFNRHILEKAQAVHPVARSSDVVTVVPGRLKLPELPAHNFIAGAVVTGNIDAAHIGAA